MSDNGFHVNISDNTGGPQCAAAAKSSDNSLEVCNHNSVIIISNITIIFLYLEHVFVSYY